MNLRGKKVIITGAGRSIGQAIAVKMAKEGADVAFSYRGNEQGSRETMEAIDLSGQRGHAIKADFLKKGGCRKFIEMAVNLLGGVDILVNNAGASVRRSFFDISSEEFLENVEINAAVPLKLSQLAAGHMIEAKASGSIINISSIAGLHAMEGRIGYCSSKACLNMVTQNAALELAPYNIRVNAIAPGFVAAGMNEERLKYKPEEWKKIVSNIPLQRAGAPLDIAQIAAFLASDESHWITGVVIPVDGGSTISFPF